MDADKSILQKHISNVLLESQMVCSAPLAGSAHGVYAYKVGFFSDSFTELFYKVCFSQDEYL